MKKLTRVGHSLALVIEKPVLDLLKIDSDTPLQVSTDGESLIVSPVRDTRRRRAFKAALEKGNRRYGRTLKRLAER